MSPGTPELLRALIGPGNRVRSVYQPIIDLESSQTIGYEALARFPDAPGRGPAEVFARAREGGALAHLDWECRRSAFVGAMRGGLRAPLHLFVNVEPSVLGAPPPWRVDPAQVADGVAMLPTVIELTERSLLSDPRSVLWAMDWARARSCLVALDDVGATPDSVAMLRFVRPDVIKLDRSLLTDEYTDEQRRTLRAVWDHVSQTGARILCEGIESERDIDRARLCGASLAQGFHLGRPAALDVADAVADADTFPVLRLDDSMAPDPTFEASTLLVEGRTRVSPLKDVARFGAALDAIAPTEGIGGCVLLSLHVPEVYTSWLSERYAELATSNTLVGILGVGEDLPPGVRGSRLQPYGDHFSFAHVHGEFSIAVVARDLGDDGPHPERRFEWMVTHVEAEVIDVARSLIRRLSPEGGADPTDPVPSIPALADIATIAVLTMPGVESAALTLATGQGTLQTLATSDQYPFLLDQLQELYGEGPGLADTQQDSLVHVDDLRTDGRWTTFAAAAVAGTPIASMLSFRLFDGLGESGFLTLYSQQKHAFGATAVESGHALAAHAAEVWTRLRMAPDGHSTDTAAALERPALSGLLGGTIGAIATRDGTSPLSVLRSIVETSASTGSSLQQTAQQMARRTSTSSTTIPGSDFSSTGPS